MSDTPQPTPYVQPTNIDEYLAAFTKNSRIDGFGFDTKMHTPCPFCAAPDFHVFKITHTEQELNQERVCKECGRGMTVLTATSEDGRSKRLSFYQTSGPDQPEWLEPKMPRAHKDPVVTSAPLVVDRFVTVAHRYTHAAQGVKYAVRGIDANRSCDWCGSVHPEDLATWIRAGMRLEQADMKYGWPHKYYSAAGTQPPGAPSWIKFYTEHLQDASPADRDTIERAMGLRITFSGDDRGTVSWKHILPWE